MSYETVIWEQSGAVGRLTLNRPETLNAWTEEFGRELKQVIDGEAADESVRAMLITGAVAGSLLALDIALGLNRTSILFPIWQAAVAVRLAVALRG